MRSVMAFTWRLLLLGSALSAGAAGSAVGQSVVGQQAGSPSAAATSYIPLVVLFLLLVWCALPLILCYRLARRKGKSKGVWLLLGLVFGWIAVLIIAAVSSERSADKR